MPVEKTKNFIRIRVADPKQFVRFRVKTLSAGKGIKAVIGFKKGGGSQIQSLLFSVSKKWTVAKARKWVKEHNYKVQEVYSVFDVLFKEQEMVFIEEVVTDQEMESEEIVERKPWEWMFDE